MPRPFTDGTLDRHLKELARKRREAAEKAAREAAKERELWGDYLYLLEPVAE